MCNHFQWRHWVVTVWAGFFEPGHWGVVIRVWWSLLRNEGFNRPWGTTPKNPFSRNELSALDANRTGLVHSVTERHIVTGRVFSGSAFRHGVHPGRLVTVWKPRHAESMRSNQPRPDQLSPLTASMARAAMLPALSVSQRRSRACSRTSMP